MANYGFKVSLSDTDVRSGANKVDVHVDLELRSNDGHPPYLVFAPVPTSDQVCHEVDSKRRHQVVFKLVSTNTKPSGSGDLKRDCIFKVHTVGNGTIVIPIRMKAIVKDESGNPALGYDSGEDDLVYEQIPTRAPIVEC